MPEAPNTPTEAGDTGTGRLSLTEASEAVKALLHPRTAEQPKAAPDPKPAVSPADALSDDDGSGGSPVDEDEDLLGGDDTPAGQHPSSESSEAETDEGDEEEEVTATTKRGKTITLKRRDLNQGLRQQDYTRKTTEAATAKKAAEAEREAFMARAKQLSDTLDAIANAEEQSLPPEPDDAERESDPGTWAAKREMRRQAAERVQGARAVRDKLHREAGEAFQKSQEERLQGEFAQLLERVPAWKDAKRRDKEMAIIRREAQHYGYTEQEVAGLTNHRDALVLRDAIRYRQLIAKRDAIKPDPTPGTPTLRPGGKQGKPDAQAERLKAANARLTKTGTVADAAELLGLLSKRKK